MLYYIYTFLWSIVPVFELRFGIPYGVLKLGVTSIMQAEAWLCYLASVLGNILPVPFLILFGGKVLHWLAKYPKIGIPFRKIIEIGETKVSKIKSKTIFAALLAFVAIPLPGTGAWTGALVAITLGLSLKKSFLPIVLGVLLAGIIVLLAATGAVTVFNIFL